MNYLSELKRRNVFKVTAAYLALVWVLLQIADVIVPALELPNSVMTALVVSATIGLPFVLVFAWVYEFTSDGIKKISDLQNEDIVRNNKGQKINYVIISLLSIAVMLLLVDRVLLSPSPQTVNAQHENSVAVMPFADMSADGSQEYLGDGIAEEILNVLARIDGLKVTSRTSSFSFRNKDILITEIADQLNVNYVLEGSIRNDGNEVRISAQLIDVFNDTTLWANTFERELTGIFEIQDEISRDVAEALQIEIVGEKVLREAPTENMLAYDLYLRGHELYLNRGVGTLSQSNERRALALLQEAVLLEPNLAEAWVDIAALNILASISGIENTSEKSFLELATEAADRAITLRPDLSQAWTAKGFVQLSKFELEEAEISLVRATELDPSNDFAWTRLGLFYSVVGDLDASKESIENAIDVSPASPVNVFYLARTMHAIGDLSEVERLIDQLEIMDFTGRTAESTFLALGQRDREKILLNIENDILANSDSAIVEANPQNMEIAGKFVDAYLDPSLRAEAKELLDRQNIPNILYRLGIFMLYDSDAIVEYSSAQADNLLLTRLYFPAFRSMLNQKVVKDYLTSTGIVEYWRSNQFPPFCRAINQVDYVCDYNNIE